MCVLLAAFTVSKLLMYFLMKSINLKLRKKGIRTISGEYLIVCVKFHTLVKCLTLKAAFWLLLAAQFQQNFISLGFFFFSFSFQIVSSLTLCFDVCLLVKGLAKATPYPLSLVPPPLMLLYHLRWHSCLYGHVGNWIRKAIRVIFNFSFSQSYF